MKIIATTLAALCLALPATANNAAHTVTFRKMNGTVLQKVEVAHGGTAVAPAGPDESADGLTFQRWDGAEKLSCVTNDVTCWALYEAATAKTPSTSIASSSIANRETPYSLDEYFQLYDTLAWSDEFSGSSLSIASSWLSTGKNWNYDTERRNNELHTYTTDGSNQTVSDGTLKLTAKLDGGSLTSCSIKSNGRVAFKYGRCEIRTKITKTKGMFPAFWMMSNGQTWQNGVEVDVFEQVCGSDWLAANYHIVYQDNSTTQNQTPVTPNDGVHWGDGFHRIGVIVNEREIVYYVDDYIFKRIDVRDTRYDRLRSYPLYIILNLAVGGNWTAAMSGDLSVSSIGDLPAGFTSEDFTIDYCRIFTNATEGKTVARPAEPEGTTLSGPVKATVWRGWQMNSGKSGSEYYKNHLAGTERRHVKTALSEYFTRDKPDIVTFLTLPKITLWNAEKEGEFDIPGTTTLFASANGDGEGAREILMNAVMFDSTRFSASDSGVNSLMISDDKAYTNCVAICANLVERESGASVKVVSVNVLSTNDYANLFQTLNSFKDERAIVLFQGFNNTYFMNDAKKKAAAQLQSPYRLLDSVNGPWPSYFFAYATECVSADTEVPAPLSVPKANGQASGVHTNQAFCAMVRFEAEEPEPVIEYGPLDTTAFAKRMTVVFPGVQSGVTLTNFPVLVRLSEAIDCFDYGDFKAANGGDLRFADADGNLIPHEIDTWSTNGVSTVWVKVPILSKNATVTACWGCSGTPPPVEPEDVWDDDYVGVWHLGERLPPMKESNGTSSDFESSTGSGIAYAVDGVAGRAVDFASGTQCALVAPDHDALDGFSQFTFEVWTKQSAHKTNAGILGKRKGAYGSGMSYYLLDADNKTKFCVSKNGTSVTTAQSIRPTVSGNWLHQVYSMDMTTSSDNINGYLNGVSTGTESIGEGTVFATPANLTLGNLYAEADNSFNGQIDEVRISKCVRSADWIKATHDTIALANFANYFAEAEGLDWTNRLFSVSGLAAGATVTLMLSAPDGTTLATLTQAADAGGNVSFSPATIPGALHDYTLSAGGETIASGSFLTGAWDAEGSWFSAAPDGNGGSTETGGTWTIPPEKTNATAYVVGSATAFSLTENARAVGEGKFIRAISALRYDFLNDPSDTFSDLALGDSLAAITAVKGTGGAAQWKACVGGAWIALSGAIAPAPDTDYLVRLEGDFTRAAPRVRLSVSDDGGASYAPLSSAATGDEWLVPNNAAATALTGIATDGTGNVAALRGQLSNTWVAEAGGVRYASLADALRAAGRGGTVTLLTSATAPASLAAGRTIIGNGHIFVTYNDWRGTLFFMQ